MTLFSKAEWEEVVKGKEWVVRILKLNKRWAVDFTILAGFHQSFTLESYERDTKKEALWCARMLGKALARLEKQCVSG